MLPSERRRQEEIAAREAAGESLWTTEFDRRALVRIAEVWIALARIDPALTEQRLASKVGFILRRSVGWDVEGMFPSRLIELTSQELIVDVVAALPEAMEMLGAYKRSIANYVEIANKVMREHRIAHKFVDGELIPFESDELLQAVVEPALRLMTDSRFTKAHDSYMDALKEIGNDKPGDAITDAGTALQEALTALGCEGDVLGALIKSAKAKGLFKSHDTQLHEAMILVTKWAASERNKNSDAHKNPDATLADAWLMVHIVGALIVRLTDPALRGQSPE